MPAKEVLEAVAAMPSEEWMKIQAGIAELIAGNFAEDEATICPCGFLLVHDGIILDC
jgi:hypothetical protein